MTREYLTYYTQLLAFAFTWYAFACVLATAAREQLAASGMDSQVITLNAKGGN